MVPSPLPFPVIRILAVSGSPRSGGNSDLLAESFARGCRAGGAETAIIQLRTMPIRPCIGCEGCRSSGACVLRDEFTSLYDEIRKAHGLFLVSPVHNYNITAWMKAFIDRLYCFYEFTPPRPGPWSSRLAGQGRAAVVASVAEQTARNDMGCALEAMRRPLEALGYEVCRELPVLGVFERGGAAERSGLLEKVEQAGRDLAARLGASPSSGRD